MRTVKEKQRVDRELFSELTESPVNPAEVFDALQYKLRRIGYVVLVLRDARSKYWVCLSLNPDEIFREPDEVIEGLSKREKELVTENQRPWAEIEGNNVFIPSTFEAMRYVCHQPEVHTIGLHFYRSEPDQTTIFFCFKMKCHSSMTLWSSSLLFRNRIFIKEGRQNKSGDINNSVM